VKLETREREQGAADTAAGEYTVIRPRGRGFRAQVAAMGKARYMMWNLIKSSAVLPYTDLALGVFWTFVRPLLFLVVIVFIRNKSNAHMGETVPYPLYVFSGLIMWWYFTDAAKQSSRSLYRYRSLLTKVYYPRLITPIVPVVARLLDLFLQCVGAVVLMFCFQCFPGAPLALLPVLLAHVMLLALGLGMLFAVLSAAIKDFERILDFVLYLAFFISPVIFSSRLISGEYKYYYAFLNPMAGPLEAFRGVLFSSAAIDYGVWAASAASTVVIAIVGLLVFVRYGEALAELVS
jgi:lipopolysaccharide transport system permease protein